jgi:hypothetical protein
MIVETEPNGLTMVRFKLYFNQQRVDPEDPWVLDYLREHGLEPRRELAEEHEGIPYKVLHFGQCYLGRHVPPLRALYQRGIEYTVLAQHIGNCLPQAEDADMRAFAASSGDAEIAAVSATLAARLHEQAQFAETAEHTLGVAIAADAIRNEFHDLRREAGQASNDRG